MKSEENEVVSMKFAFAIVSLALLVVACGSQAPESGSQPSDGESAAAEQESTTAPTQPGEETTSAGDLPAGFSACTAGQRNEECPDDVYTPACGAYNDGYQQTFPSSCFACTQPDVVGYKDGAC